MNEKEPLATDSEYCTTNYVRNIDYSELTKVNEMIDRELTTHYNLAGLLKQNGIQVNQRQRMQPLHT